MVAHMVCKGRLLVLLALLLAACAAEPATKSGGECGPEGVRWAYARPTGHRLFDVFTLRGGKEHQLTRDQASYHPSISPDGRRIVFTRGLGESLECCGFERTQLYVMDADGTDQRPLLDHERDTSPSWSPRGDQIAFTRRVGTASHDLMVVPVAGGSPRAVARGVLSGSTPVWSPDGTTIAWAGERGIETVLVATGERRSVPLGADALVSEPPAWTPGGDGFVVALHGQAAEQDGGLRKGLYRISLGGARRDLRVDADLPALLPTGRLAAVELERDDETPSSLVVMEPDGRDRRRVAGVGVHFPYHGVTFSGAICKTG